MGFFAVDSPSECDFQWVFMPNRIWCQQICSWLIGCVDFSGFFTGGFSVDVDV